MILRLARGDYLERIRRPAFLVSLAFMIYAAYVYLPPGGSGYLTLDIHGFRPRYNSAGVGGLLTLLANTFIGLAGFYLVRGAIQRDRESGVGAVLAATPLSRIAYLQSKLWSGFAVLASMMAMLWLAGAVLQRVLHEDSGFDPIAMVQPLVVFCLPAMLMVAAVAVAFDSWPLFRGGLGNVAYFFLWMGSLARAGLTTRSVDALSDPYGANAIIRNVMESARAGAPGVRFGNQDVSVGFHIMGAGKHVWPSLIEWHGVALTWPIVASRLGWIAAAVLLVAASALVFDRFAEAGAPGRRRWWQRASGAAQAALAGDGAEAASVLPAPRALALAIPKRGGSLVPLLLAEWALLVRPTRAVWKLAALGLMIAECFAPMTVARTFLVMAAWIWPIFVWSEMGSRERRFGTAPLLFSAPRPLLRPLVASWLAGAGISLALVLPVVIRSLALGHAPDAASLIVGAAFIPAMALACGSLTGGRKLFEILYLLLWYAGPLNHMPALDYTGATPGAAGAAGLLRFTLAAALLLSVAWAGRRRFLAG